MKGKKGRWYLIGAGLALSLLVVAIQGCSKNDISTASHKKVLPTPTCAKKEGVCQQNMPPGCVC